MTEPGAAAAIVATCDALLLEFDAHSSEVERRRNGDIVAAGICEGLERASAIVRGVRAHAVGVVIANAERAAR